MDRPAICDQLRSEPSPLTVISPDGRYAAVATRSNTVEVFSAEGAVCTYFGHREGIYHLSGRVVDVRWDAGKENASFPWLITSRSTTGATHRWNLHGIHVATVNPASRLVPKER